MDKPKIDWEPSGGYLLIMPTQTKIAGGLIVPESMTRKNNSGVVIKTSGLYEDLKGLEVLFPINNEYVVKDTETNTLFYLVHGNNVIATRKPQPL